MKHLLAGGLAAVLLCACGADSPIQSRLSFSYTSPTPAHYEGLETICLNEPIHPLMIDATLKLEGGPVIIQVVTSPEADILWEQTYTQNAAFTMKLKSLQPEVEYYLAVTGEDITKLDLQLESAAKLVPDLDTPAISAVEPPSTPAVEPPGEPAVEPPGEPAA